MAESRDTVKLQANFKKAQKTATNNIEWTKNNIDKLRETFKQKVEVFTGESTESAQLISATSSTFTPTAAIVEEDQATKRNLESLPSIAVSKSSNQNDLESMPDIKSNTEKRVDSEFEKLSTASDFNNKQLPSIIALPSDLHETKVGSMSTVSDFAPNDSPAIAPEPVLYTENAKIGSMTQVVISSPRYPEDLVQLSINNSPVGVVYPKNGQEKIDKLSEINSIVIQPQENLPSADQKTENVEATTAASTTDESKASEPIPNVPESTVNTESEKLNTASEIPTPESIRTSENTINTPEIVTPTSAADVQPASTSDVDVKTEMPTEAIQKETEEVKTTAEETTTGTTTTTTTTTTAAPPTTLPPTTPSTAAPVTTTTTKTITTTQKTQTTTIEDIQELSTAAAENKAEPEQVVKKGRIGKKMIGGTVVILALIGAAVFIVYKKKMQR